MTPLLLFPLLVTRSADPLDQMVNRGLTDLGAYRMLTSLCTEVGHRISGSARSERSIQWVEREMKRMGLSNIQRVPCKVPRWVRGDVERATMVPGGKLSVLALGMSVGTPKGGITAEVIEVKSLQEAEALGTRGKGKIVFFNRGFDPTKTVTFEAYGGAVDQRVRGASAAAKSGAVAVLVRSMTLAKDDSPHTGAMGYSPGVKKIPAAALGIKSADRLSAALKKGRVKVKLTLSCQNLPDVPSANVIGEIPGTESGDVIALGGHLDSWDVGQGAHDDAAGVVQALEAVRLMKALNLKPKRTIRVVAWMNEENGGRGAAAYAERAKTEPHLAAMESDAGGFMPRAVGVTASKLDIALDWLPRLRRLGVEQIVEGGTDADNGPLEPLGVTCFSLIPENQRYFDYHHSWKDTIDKVNPRELEFGPLTMASVAWLCSETGLNR